MALLNVYNGWAETNFASQWCFENFVQASALRLAGGGWQLSGFLKAHAAQAWPLCRPAVSG